MGEFTVGDTIRVRWSLSPRWNAGCNSYWCARDGQLVVIERDYGGFYEIEGRHPHVLDRSWAVEPMIGLAPLLKRYRELSV